MLLLIEATADPSRHRETSPKGTIDMKRFSMVLTILAILSLSSAALAGVACDKTKAQAAAAKGSCGDKVEATAAAAKSSCGDQAKATTAAMTAGACPAMTDACVGAKATTAAAEADCGDQAKATTAAMTAGTCGDKAAQSASVCGLPGSSCGAEATTAAIKAECAPAAKASTAAASCDKAACDGVKATETKTASEAEAKPAKEEAKTVAANTK
jgi:hypothetical protein